MGGALSFALRRTSARVVVAVGAGGLVLAVFRALRPVREGVLAIGMAGPEFELFRLVDSSPGDLAAASLGLAIAVVAGAALFRTAK